MSESREYGSRKLEVYKLAHRLGLQAHALSLTLPYFEQREEGSQLRRSSKSASTQIVEGYRLRKYKDEFLHYLHRAAGSADESIEHLDYLVETGSLKDASAGRALSAEYDMLLAALSRFIASIERDHSKPFYLRAANNPPPPPNPQSPI